jgi:hypothetical protein
VPTGLEQWRLFISCSDVPWTCNAGRAGALPYHADTPTRRPADTFLLPVAQERNQGWSLRLQASGYNLISQKIVQLFAPRRCPVSETQQTAMKNNIIDFRPQQNTYATTGQCGWIPIQTEVASGFVDSLLALWLGGWSLYAGFECLQATGFLVF